MAERNFAREEIDLSQESWLVSQHVVDKVLITGPETCVSTNAKRYPSLSTFSWPGLYVWSLRKATLDVNSSLVFTSGFVVKQSGTFTRRARDAAFISGATSRLTAGRTRVIPGPVAGIGDIWHHYHFMLETLPQMLRIRKAIPGTKFVSSASPSAAARSVLDALGFEVIWLPAGTVLESDHIVVGDRSPQFQPRPSEIDMLNNAFPVLDESVPPQAIIFASRQGASRNPANAMLLEQALDGSGASVVNFESLDIFDQVHAARRARVLLGFHGAGLVNASFLLPGSTLVELSSGYRFEGCYEAIASAKGLVYQFIQLGGSSNHPDGVITEETVQQVLKLVDSERFRFQEPTC